jgi:hypothetical protein
MTKMPLDNMAVQSFRAHLLADLQVDAEHRSRAAGCGKASLSSNAASSVPQDAIELEFWQSVQASGAVEEYSAYLDRYPDGIFAPLARERLARPDILERPQPAPEGSAVELAFWDTVKESGNPAMFQACLEQSPTGCFKALAEIGLTELERANNDSMG